MRAEAKRRVADVVFVILVATLVGALVYKSLFADGYGSLRQRMVERQLKGPGRDIEDKRVLAAMAKVPREEFVPDERKAQAYADTPLSIGYGQTISQPYIVAKMTELLEPDKHDVCLEIGTGSGYQAAVLAEIVKEVYTIEIIEGLAKPAKQRLQRLGYRNITTKIGDGYYGWKEHGPYDGIVVTAAANHVPPPLKEQLKKGGKMVIPVGGPFSLQQLTLVEKRKDGKFDQHIIFPVSFVPLTGGH
ncbi:MAG: protein-L-isoaspartate(D-aspartate) O-methyltransferase [Armatimonadota bacterium]